MAEDRLAEAARRADAENAVPEDRVVELDGKPARSNRAAYRVVLDRDTGEVRCTCEEWVVSGADPKECQHTRALDDYGPEGGER